MKDINQLFDTKTIIALAILVIGIPLLWYLVTKGNRAIKKQNAVLWQQYQQALKAGDKQKALNAGRTYYAAVRGGKLSIYDEQALNNDLQAMK